MRPVYECTLTFLFFLFLFFPPFSILCSYFAHEVQVCRMLEGQGTVEVVALCCAHTRLWRGRGYCVPALCSSKVAAPACLRSHARWCAVAARPGHDGRYLLVCVQAWH